MTKIYIYTFFFTIPFLLILCTAPNRPTFHTPSTDFSWRTPKTKPRNDSGEKFICCFCSFLLLAFFSRFICLSPVFNVCFKILYYIKDLKTNIKLFSRPFSFVSRFSRRTDSMVSALDSRSMGLGFRREFLLSQCFFHQQKYKWVLADYQGSLMKCWG